MILTFLQLFSNFLVQLFSDSISDDNTLPYIACKTAPLTILPPSILSFAAVNGANKDVEMSHCGHLSMAAQVLEFADQCYQDQILLACSFFTLLINKKIALCNFPRQR